MGGPWSWRTLVVVALACAPVRNAGAAEDLGDLSLEELMAIEVSSATRTEEPLAEAPATVIVLTHEDLVARGYRELADVLDDLPGMDVVRGWGDHWFASYVRGHRKVYGSAYLVLIDGMVFNDIWFHDDETPLATYPLSAVEQIEIVYGPVSAIYGANALAGVVHVKTRHRDDDGHSTSMSLGMGTLGRRIFDVAEAYRDGELDQRRWRRDRRGRWLGELLQLADAAAGAHPAGRRRARPLVARQVGGRSSAARSHFPSVAAAA